MLFDWVSGVPEMLVLAEEHKRAMEAAFRDAIAGGRGIGVTKTTWDGDKVSVSHVDLRDFFEPKPEEPA
jgi:hypothetical protein